MTPISTELRASLFLLRALLSKISKNKDDCDRIEKEIGQKCHVIATGGLAKTIIKHCEHEIEIHENLILNGLCRIYERNKKGEW